MASFEGMPWIIVLLLSGSFVPFLHGFTQTSVEKRLDHLVPNVQNMRVFEDSHDHLGSSDGRYVTIRELLTDDNPVDLEGEIVNKKVACDLCRYFFTEVQKLLKLTRPEEIIVNFAIDFCITLKIEDKRVCEMIVAEFREQFKYIVLNSDHLPDELCGQYFNKVCPPYEGPWWNVTLPNTDKPKPHPPKPPVSGSPTLKFLKLSDIHIDFQYKEGTILDCGEPVCCRDFVKPTRPLTLTAHKAETTKAGKYGNPEYCDAAPSMVVSMFQHLNKIKDQFDFVVFTGDVPAHDVWNQTQATQLAHIDYLDHMFSTYLPGKPVYYSMGNHEAAPVNTFPPLGIEGFNNTWLYEPLSKIWGKYLDDAARQTILQCGHYSFSPYPGFRIISLNSIYAYNMNFLLIVNSTDPCGSLHWLAEELNKAEIKGEKVHILTHVPNGSTLKPWSWNFYSIVNRYENTIVNMFNGHSHTDWFQVYYDEATSTRPLGIAWVGPCASGHTALNPTYRIYTMDGNYPGSSWAVLDFDNYWLNVTKANEEGSADWEFMYNPKTAYNMTSLYAADWNDLIHRMDTDDDLFQKFYMHYHSLYPHEKCSKLCKKKLLRSLAGSRKQ